MILGILSDSHGRAERTAAAIRLLRACGAASFVHCGDIGTAEVLDELLTCAARFVWGNNDDPAGPLARYAQAIGLARPAALPLALDLDGKRIAVCHGHERVFDGLWRTAENWTVGAADAFDYVLFGHSHVPTDRRRGPARFVNPGALHRAPTFTVATLALDRDELQFWEVVDRAAPNDPPRPYPLRDA